MAMSGKKLVLIGGGGHCKSVLDAAVRSGCFSEIVITDHSIPAGNTILGCKVAGNDELLPELFAEGFKYAFVTIGSIRSTDKRRAVFLKAKKAGFLFPAIIDPSAAAAASALIAPGVFIGKNAVVNADAVIGDMAIINTGAIVEHDCRIGTFAHISVGAAVCGGAEIERDVFVGANATVIQGVRIGMNSIIGAGSIICRDVPENCTVTGVFHGGGVNDTLNYLSFSYESIHAYRYFKLAGRYAV